MTKDVLGSNLQMNKEQALGYMLLSCKNMNLSQEQVKQIYLNMTHQFNQQTPEEAKKEGEEWFLSTQEKANTIKSNSVVKQKPKSLFKKASVEIPKITEANNTKRLREKNERLIAELQRNQDGPFSLCRFFRCGS